MRFGCIPDESLETYHACEAVSKTKLDTFRKSAELYRKTHLAKEIPRREATPAMLFGQQLGCYELEGVKAWSERYYTLPEGLGNRSAADKATRATLEAANIGKSSVDLEDMKVMIQMHLSLRKNPTYRQLVSTGIPEVTFRVPGRLFPVQVRPDWWNEAGCEITDGYPYIVDLKTIAKLPKDDPDHLSRHIAEYGYHRSAYLYPKIVAMALKWKPDLPPPRFFLAFIEKEEPYSCEVVELTDTDVDIGRLEVTGSLQKLTRCMETGIWIEPQDKPHVVSLPGYYVRRALDSQ